MYLTLGILGGVGITILAIYLLIKKWIKFWDKNWP